MLFDHTSAELQGKRGLEIGGPTRIFARGGFFPVYPILADLWNCNFGPNTLWEGTIAEGRTFHFDADKAPGQQLIREATDLTGVSSDYFDVVLSSHNIEHVANPLAALHEWRRTLRPGGLLVLVVPHKDGTFDRRRPSTPISHLVEDYERGMGEDDTTHLDEVLRLHDVGLDPDAADRAQFEARVRDNLHTRVVHHHVFDTTTVAEMLACAGYALLEIEARLPFHVLAVARNPSGAERPTFPEPLRSQIRRSSVFRSDRCGW